MSQSHHHAHKGGGDKDYPQLTFEAGQAKSVKSLTLNRFNNFQGGHYESVNLTSALYTTRADGSAAVKLEVWSPKAGEKPSFDEAKKQKYKPAKKGDSFGPSWSNHWFKITLNVPKGWLKYERVQFEFDPGCEGLIYTPEGLPIHAIVGGTDGLRRVEYILDKKARESSHHIYIETSCNGMFGVPQGGAEIEPPDPNRYYTLALADLVVPCMPAWHLMWDFNLLTQIARSDDANSPLSERAMRAANEIINVFEASNPAETIEKARKIAEDILGEGWQKDAEGVFQVGGKKSEADAKLWGLGHCHIDSAWLWPFSVTQQKVARSWSSQVDLMNRYPEHRFSATSAQQYKWLETLYPLLFDKVKEKIEQGSFGYIGSTWIEMDTNLPSGESLCRQFLYGQRYFKSRFGKTCDTFVLPDTFGYSSQLPQIARLGGSKHFFTQKLSWNTINKFPHSSFNWVGLDGSQLLTHMTPVDTYNAQADFDEVKKGANNNKNLEVTGDALYLFGNGDGGGGPTAPMLELRRIRALGNTNREVPLVRMGSHMDEFFDHLRKTTDNGTKLPNWRGELYFELHRGTYTSHGFIKKGNRKSEILLRDAEYLATLAVLIGKDKSYVYPRKELDECWENLLLCQFHDVLPGSALEMVYDDADAYYASIAKSCATMLEDAFKSLFPDSHPLHHSPPPASPTSSSFFSSAKSTQAQKRQIFGVNTLRVPRREVVEVELDPKRKKEESGLRQELAQVAKDGKKGWMIVDASAEEGVAEVKGVFADEFEKGVSAQDLGGGNFSLKNSSVEFKISAGRISSLYDVALGRELIPDGKTGGFVLFQDVPNYWDAWDVEIHHLQHTPKHLVFSSVSVSESGPLRAALDVKVQVGQGSEIKCTISLDAIAGSLKKDARSLIRFETTVDWHERHKFLKFELPLDVNANEATYETQFGTVQRPTHRNTSWDVARFEVCAHKFADVSEFGYGVALINDCKYGYAVEGQTMRLSLLRGPTSPDATTDQGVHTMKWAIYPHVGGFLESDVPHVAQAFNSPMLLRSSSTPVLPSPVNSAVTVLHARNVLAETIKLAEDQSHHTNVSASSGKETRVIVRLYEAFGGHAKAVLKIKGLGPILSAHLTNALEDALPGNESKLEVRSDKGGKDDEALIDLKFRGFEVKTVLLVVGEKKKEKDEGWVRVEIR